LNRQKRKKPQVAGNGLLRKRVLLAASGALVTVLLAEGGARLFAPPAPPNSILGLVPSQMPDPDLLWTNKPGYPLEDDYGPINTDGFRGAEVPRNREPGEVRILSLGESTTFGFGLKWTETYSHLLELLLREAGYNVRVLNAATRGWTTYQSARYLELRIEMLRPDIVLFYHELNDFLPTTVRGISFRGAGLTDSQVVRMLRGWANRLIERSRFMTWLRLAIVRRQALPVLRKAAIDNRQDLLNVGLLPYLELPDVPLGHPKPWMENPHHLVRVPDREREDLLRGVIDTTRRHGAQLLFLHPVYPVSKRHVCLQTRLAEKENVPLIDLEDVILKDAVAAGRQKSDYFFPKDIFHANLMGHATIARAVADFLVSGGFLIGARSSTGR
jgi:lysophospholipase L1-like esterase